MAKPSDPLDADGLRDAVIGLGGRSLRKSYYGKLRQSRDELARFRVLLDDSRDAIVVAELPSWRVADANRAGRALIAAGAGAADPASLDALLGADERARLRAALDASAAREGGSAATAVSLRLGGAERHFELSLRAATFEGRRYALLVFTDVTERRRAQAEDRLVTALLRVFTLARPVPELLDAVVEEVARATGCGGVGIRVLDSGGAAPYRASRGMPGSLLSAECCDASGFQTHAVVPVEHDGRVVAALHLVDGAPDRLGPDDLRVLEKIAPVVGELLSRARAEARVREAERLTALGTVAAGVAHEINNPLAYVSANLGYVEEALRACGGDPDALAALVDTRHGLARVRDIVADLKLLSRVDPDARPCALDLRGPLRAAVSIATNEIRHRASLVLRLDGPVPPVEAVEHRLVQAFLNLAINAAQAIPEGRAQEHEVRITAATAPDGRALVEFRDTGCGIEPHVKARMFEPFFTTKPVGMGTGLGLSIVHEVVRKMGGEVTVDSEVGKGAVFRVLLPPAFAGCGPLPPAPPRRG